MRDSSPSHFEKQSQGLANALTKDRIAGIEGVDGNILRMKGQGSDAVAVLEWQCVQVKGKDIRVTQKKLGHGVAQHIERGGTDRLAHDRIEHVVDGGLRTDMRSVSRMW